MAGKDEFAIDLAKKAVMDCLAKSSYYPRDIDLLICCNISRVDKENSLSFEPSTSIKIKKEFGFTHALAFDITNACAGMFTGIYIADALIQSGSIQTAMIVSGEYITHLTNTAQREIEGFMDSRLACLTLGDAGAAITLKRGSNNKSGFHNISLHTLGRFSNYCIAKEAESGGWIMYTDSVKLTQAAIGAGAHYALDILRKSDWSPDEFQHLVMHQTSRMTLHSAKREINKIVGRKIIHQENLIDNLTNRGNTASTSHFVALADSFLENRIAPGDKTVFNIAASGLTVGTALYEFDDLPEKFKRKPEVKVVVDVESKSNTLCPSKIGGIRVQSVGTYISPHDKQVDTLELLHAASLRSLKRSVYEIDDIGLLMYTGVYRSEYLMEPAYAALLAGKINIGSSEMQNKVLAFDVFNGELGFLNACYIAQHLIHENKSDTSMIVAAETDNNASNYPAELTGIENAASAIILDVHPDNKKGFSRFCFNYDLESISSYDSFALVEEDGLCMHMQKDDNLEDKYLDCINQLIQKILEEEKLSKHQIQWILPPQISPFFTSKLSAKLGQPIEKFIDLSGNSKDLFTSSIPFCFEHLFDNGMSNSDDIALLIGVGSGLQAGSAIYRF